ncbi:hypothetical protein D3C86_2139060 [compost metagenome]
MDRPLQLLGKAQTLDFQIIASMIQFIFKSHKRGIAAKHKSEILDEGHGHFQDQLIVLDLTQIVNDVQRI